MKAILKVIALYFAIFAPVMSSCQTSPEAIKLHGHRGCRGLMPENTVPSFIRALELGVDVLELDVVVSGEGELIVSHEPWFSEEICLDPVGNELSSDSAMRHNIYRMSYAEIAAFDCGSKFHVRFPNQEKLKVSKPRLSDLIDAVNEHCRQNNLAKPFWNIELKSLPEWDNVYIPAPAAFVKLLDELVHKKGITDQCMVQSFDFRVLREFNKLNPPYPIAMLIDNHKSAENNLSELGFTPQIYSPHYILVNKELVEWCHQNGMEIHPWTVNQVEAMEKMIKNGVDGLITDYPDRFNASFKK